MNVPDFPHVEKGQPITAALWRLAGMAVRAVRLRRGPGIRLRWTPDGTVISADGGPPRFIHPFLATVVGSSATFVPGTVNGAMPLIAGTVLDADPAPKLTWDELKLDDQGRGFFAIELGCDEKWKLDPKTLTLVQVADWRTEDGNAADTPSLHLEAPSLKKRRTRWPVAALRQRASGTLDVFPVTMAPLIHQAVPKTLAAETARHFFY